MIPQPAIKRYLMSFDGASYAAALDEQKHAFNRLNKVNDLYAQLSKELDENIDSIDTVEAILGLSTGFKNLSMAADALGIKNEYNELNQLLSEGLPAPAAVTTKNGKAVPKQAYLDKLKEQYETFLPVDQRKVYDALEKACEIINSCNTMERNAIVRAFDGSYYINIARLYEARKYKD